jgi:outer membrane protein TolC
MLNKIGISLLACIAIIAAGVLSLSGAEEVLTLDKAISTAYGANPRMIEARRMVDAARGAQITAGALANPEVAFEISGLMADEEGERVVRLGEFEVVQSFDPPGVYGLKTGIAKSDLMARREFLKSIWAGVYSEVREAYAGVILDEKRIELAATNLDVYRRFYSQVELRYQSGKALKNELQRSKIELLRSESSFLVAQRQLKTGKARLSLLLGRAMDEEFSIKEELREDSLTVDLAAVYASALSNNPEIKAEEFLMKSAAKGLTREQLNRLPSPYVGFKNINESYDRDYAIVIGASVPLWDMNQGAVETARAQKGVQETRLAAVRRSVAFNAYQAYLDVELSQKQLELLKKSLEEANELLRVADLSYSEGGIDFINFLDQVKTATETRMRYYEGLFDLNNAVSRLEKVMYSSLRKEGYLQ